MNRSLIWFGIAVCIYLAIGTLFRITCMTATPSNGVVYFAGEDHYRNSVHYDLNPDMTGMLGSTTISILIRVYYYSTGVIEDNTRTDKAYYKIILNRLQDISTNHELVPGDRIFVYDSSNLDDYRIIKADGSIELSQLPTGSFPET